MNLMRWEPFRETDDFLRNLSTPMFGRWPQFLGEERATKFEWSPVVDIKETETEYLVNAELPGVKKADLGNVIDTNPLHSLGILPVKDAVRKLTPEEVAATTD